MVNTPSIFSSDVGRDLVAHCGYAFVTDTRPLIQRLPGFRRNNFLSSPWCPFHRTKHREPIRYWRPQRHRHRCLRCDRTQSRPHHRHGSLRLWWCSSFYPRQARSPRQSRGSSSSMDRSNQIAVPQLHSVSQSPCSHFRLACSEQH